MRTRLFCRFMPLLIPGHPASPPPPPLPPPLLSVPRLCGRPHLAGCQAADEFFMPRLQQRDPDSGAHVGGRVGGRASQFGQVGGRSIGWKVGSATRYGSSAWAKVAVTREEGEEEEEEWGRES